MYLSTLACNVTETGFLDNFFSSLAVPMNDCSSQYNSDINKSIHKTRKKILQQFLSSDESPQSLTPSHSNCFGIHFPLSQ